MTSRKGQDRAPDVLDVGPRLRHQRRRAGPARAVQGSQAFDDIPAAQKDAEGRWYNDYGGYVSIGCDATRREVPEDLRRPAQPEYKGKVALNGNPTKSGSAFARRLRGRPRQRRLLRQHPARPRLLRQALKKDGNFNPGRVHPGHHREGRDARSASTGTTSTPATPSSPRARASTGRSPSRPTASSPSSTRRPSKKDAPHPAAARLWQEFLYSAEGQNLWLKGYARPVLHARHGEGRHARQGRRRQAARGRRRRPTFPTEEQSTKAKAVARPGLGQGRRRMTPSS